MAGAADLGIVRLSLFSTWNVVGIVASSATHFAAALQKAGRLTKAICCGGNFEFTVMAGAGGVIEMELIIGKRLTGLVGKDAAIVALNGSG